MNTIAHGVFGDALWIQRTRDLNRIEWFRTIVKNGREEEMLAEVS